MPGRSVDEIDASVVFDAGDMHMSCDKDVRASVDDHVVDVFRCKGCVASVGWCKMSFLQHVLHNWCRLVVVECLDVGGKVKKANAVVAKYFYIMNSKRAWVAQEQVVSSGKKAADVF